MVGNDIVDLHFIDSPCYQHVEHLRRVSTAEELHVVRNANKPSVTLAALWASKEAAYKLFSKKTNCRFVPKRFVVCSGNLARLTATGTAMVTHGGVSAKVELSLTENWVHAIAISPGVQAVRSAVHEIERSCREVCQAQAESEAVRFLAAELISRYCREEVLLDFHGRTPILTLKAGGRAAIDVSFSHHGKFAAVAMAWPIGNNSRILPGSGFLGTPGPREEMCSTCTA